MNDVYLNQAKLVIPFLISNIDREPHSLTFGSFDRIFWSWKFTDFKASRLQEGIFTLCWLFKNNFEGNDYYNNERMLEWICGSLEHWMFLQHRDGSFDEAYPFERSFAATAFSTFYVSEGITLIENQLPKKILNSTMATIRKACTWLQRNTETHGILSNHIAAGAAALTSANSFFEDREIEYRIDELLNTIFEHQSTEGWYEEYGGPDIGYQTHCLFYLARIWQLRPSKMLLNSLRSACRFSSYFVHLNGTFGGEYMYRNTTFYFPAAFEMLGDKCEYAAAIAEFLKRSVERQKSVGLQMMDIQNYQPMLNNYLFASDNKKKFIVSKPLPFVKQNSCYFKHAGIFIKNTASYQAILGLSKGGILKIYDKNTGELSYSDCGYIKTHKRHKSSSQSTSLSTTWIKEEEIFSIKAPFIYLNQTTLYPWRFITFRLFSLTFGRHPFVSKHLKRLLVSILVTRKKRVNITLQRRVDFHENKIVINDLIEGWAAGQKGEELYWSPKFSTFHMGSSRYFQPDELRLPAREKITSPERVFCWESDSKNSFT